MGGAGGVVGDDADVWSWLNGVGICGLGLVVGGRGAVASWRLVSGALEEFVRGGRNGVWGWICGGEVGSGGG